MKNDMKIKISMNAMIATGDENRYQLEKCFFFHWREMSYQSELVA